MPGFPALVCIVLFRFPLTLDAFAYAIDGTQVLGHLGWGWSWGWGWGWGYINVGLRVGLFYHHLRYTDYFCILLSCRKHYIIAGQWKNNISSASSWGLSKFILKSANTPNLFMTERHNLFIYTNWPVLHTVYHLPQRGVLFSTQLRTADYFRFLLSWSET